MDAHKLRLATVIPLQAYRYLPPCDACKDVDTSKHLQVGLMSPDLDMPALQYFNASDMSVRFSGGLVHALAMSLNTRETVEKDSDFV